MSKRERSEGNDWKRSVYNSLLELGLDEGAIGLYTTSIALGPTSITALARHLELSRPSVYKLIGRLASAGLAKQPAPHARRTRFAVEPVSTILDQLREKKTSYSDLDRQLTASMPDVIAIYKKTARPASIHMHHGRAQLKRLYESILEVPKGDIRFFGSAQTFLSFLTPEEFAERTRRKVEAGIWNRGLVPSSERRLTQPNPEKELRDVRVFESSAASSTIFQLVGDKVIFWWPETLMAMSVADPSLFKMMEDIFERYWDSAVPSKDFFDAEGNPKTAAPART